MDIADENVDTDFYMWFPVHLSTSFRHDLTTLNVVVQFLWLKSGTFRRFVKYNKVEKWCTLLAPVFYTGVTNRSLLPFARVIKYREQGDSFENCLETILDLLPVDTRIQAIVGLFGHYHIINRCDLCVPVNKFYLDIVRVRGHRLDLGSILVEIERPRGRVCADATHTSIETRELDSESTRGFLIDIDEGTIDRHGVLQNIVKGGETFAPTVVITSGPNGYVYFFRIWNETAFYVMDQQIERREPQPEHVRIVYFEKQKEGKAGAPTPPLPRRLLSVT